MQQRWKVTSVKQGVMCTEIIRLQLNAAAVFVHLCAARYMQKYFTLMGEFMSSLSRFCQIRVQTSVFQSRKENSVTIQLYFYL